MILEGNQRGGARDLALHLLNEENDHVEIFDMRGFVSDNLVDAFRESYALSRGTKCKQHLFSLSVNPPAKEQVSTEAFEDAIARTETQLGLENQPRAIVFHEKKGRRHAHAVWCRINTQAMKAVQLSFTKRKLMEVSRELYIKYQWVMPRGLMASEERDPTNYTMAQWQQAKRIGKDPKQIKAAFQDCWAVSDTQAAFAAALKERGYILAQGDKSRIVAVDYLGEVYFIAKWVGIRAKEVRTKLNDTSALPSVTKARENLAKAMSTHLAMLQQTQNIAVAERLALLGDKAKYMTTRHRKARQTLKKQIDDRKHHGQLMQPQPLTGWRGVWQRLTGQHQKIKQRQAWQAYLSGKYDQAQKDQLIFAQLQERQRLEHRTQRLKQYQQVHSHVLQQDIHQYEQIQKGEHEVYKTQRSHNQDLKLKPSLSR